MRRSIPQDFQATLSQPAKAVHDGVHKQQSAWPLTHKVPSPILAHHGKLSVTPDDHDFSCSSVTVQASGVEASDECITAYQELKLGKKAKYILFALNDANTAIVVDKTSVADASYDDFVQDLPKDQCRWAVYDFEFAKQGEGKRNKIGFISWCVTHGGRSFRAPGSKVLTRDAIRSPEDATVKDKMLFASSREALRRRLDGIAFEVQGTDPSEISYNTGSSPTRKIALRQYADPPPTPQCLTGR